MNEGDVASRSASSAAERLIKRHGGTFAGGAWDRAAGLSEDGSRTLTADLELANYQVRSRFKAARELWEVIFR